MLILVRLAGEVTTKSSRVRARFQRQLVRNIQDALRAAGLEHSVRNEWSRLFVEASGQEALEVLTRVFGISSVSELEHRCAPELHEIVRTGEAAYAKQVQGRSFAVRARRSGEHPFKSQDIHVQLGAALDRHATVDLDHPEVTVHVEVRPDAAYLFTGQLDGPGGLPVGVEGRAVALVSGGFDSALAAWLMLKRGVALDYVLCNLAGAAYKRAVLGVVKVLADAWSYGSRPTLHTVAFEPVVMALRRDVRPQYVQVVLKRLMYRVAVRIAEELGAEAVITGESVGQVSSQTLSNLRAINEVASLPVLRPLAGMDKEEIVRTTHRIGTYALSALVQEYCAVVPDRPVTAARPEAVRDQEARLDLTMLDQLVAQRNVEDVRSLGPSDLVGPYLYTSEIPEGAVVIDCRPLYHYRAWHYPDAQHYELDNLLTNFHSLDRSRAYVLYCPLGLQSAAAAEKMQRAGYEAYSFKGGTQSLRRYAQSLGEED